MQSEEADEAIVSDKMTFAKNLNFPPSSEQPIDPLEFCSTTIKLEDINLEDEIEKVDGTSDDEGEASSSESEEKISDVSINQFAIPLFSEIPEENPNESVKNWLKQISEAQHGSHKRNFAALGLQTVGNAPSRVVKYEDLPYMGEMTLNNNKPRRGRKPKKADICHLIYKNYGTIFPGTPNANNLINAGIKRSFEAGKSGHKKGAKNSENMQNKLISSLLEKRLTQDSNPSEMKKPITTPPSTSEPLNLCVRDHNPLKMRLLKNKNDNTYTSEMKSEPLSDDDIEIVTSNTTPSSPVEVKVESRVPSATPDSESTSSTEASTPEGIASGSNGFVYWPNTGGAYLHPMALQQQLLLYQQLAASNPNFVIPTYNHRPPSAKDSNVNELHNIDHPKTTMNKREKTENDHNSPKEKTKRIISSSNNVPGRSNDKCPAKRKRSAIFIPPIPAENSNNPATEVSICKFKFTGGAKPSLQEKKMLSVDSGGNFRYYSGTGDKSMRGYEFFPREQLQQQVSNSQGSSTGAFLQASGEKIYPVPPVELTGGIASADFLLNSDLSKITIPEKPIQESGKGSTSKKDKKRKSRKSLQREKLEKTFKEKGFLIQTQQLESSEGATYCKFRQLKKFTRYLFRSWKDYLPGELQGQPGQEGGSGENQIPCGGEIPVIDSTVDSNLSALEELPSSSTTGT